MTTTVPTQQQPKGGGCGKGCALLLGLLLFFGLALAGGTYWAFHHFRDAYSSEQPLNLPTSTTSEIEMAVPDAPSASMTAPAPAEALPHTRTRSVQARWKAFEKAADRHEKARIELTAAEINSLIEDDPELAGKASVSIENNLARLQVSVPLDGMMLMEGRYLNAEATIESAPDGDPKKARIYDITLGRERVPDGVLNRQMFGWPSVRTMVAEWLDDQEISVFRIEGGKVIGETRGQ